MVIIPLYIMSLKCLQEKIKAGADLVELGKENGCDFEEHNLKTFFEELIHEDVITDFEDELCDMYCEKYGV